MVFWDGACEFTFLGSSQLRGRLQIWGPYSEDPCCRGEEKPALGRQALTGEPDCTCQLLRIKSYLLPTFCLLFRNIEAGASPSRPSYFPRQKQHQTSSSVHSFPKIGNQTSFDWQLSGETYEAWSGQDFPRLACCIIAAALWPWFSQKMF